MALPLPGAVYRLVKPTRYASPYLAHVPCLEHPFRVIKRQFGHVKARYRGLAKNGSQLVTLFALSNLWLARRTLLAR